jgi:hypothetical protein
MASLESKIEAAIFAFPALANLLAKRLDNNPAVYDTQLQQGSAFPAIVQQLIAGGQTYTLNSRLSTSFNRVQFTIWALSPETARQIEQQLYAFLDGFNPAGVRADLTSAPNFVVLSRQGMYTATQPPVFWRINDANIFDNSAV